MYTYYFSIVPYVYVHKFRTVTSFFIYTIDCIFNIQKPLINVVTFRTYSVKITHRLLMYTPILSKLTCASF